MSTQPSDPSSHPTPSPAEAGDLHATRSDSTPPGADPGTTRYPDDPHATHDTGDLHTTRYGSTPPGADPGTTRYPDDPHATCCTDQPASADGAQQTPNPPPCVPGYEVLGKLGRGGMGVVYKARHLALGRVVALKMILSAEDAEEEELARFRTEAQAFARLNHPHIVQIYEVGQHQGRPFISLEYMEGGSLVGKTSGAAWGPAEAAGFVERLARAVSHAHERGVVHRDLKPANILLAANGDPKITDFGLAKHLDRDEGQTRTGAVMGTPAYMAPEQAAGRTREIGPAVDLYALGVILYELLTGRTPFTASGVRELLEQVQSADPPPPSRLQRGVPRDLETICLKCLAKNPAGRYRSALALAQDLERFRAGEPILGRREPLPARVWRRARRRPVLLAVAAVVVALLLSGGAALRAWYAQRSAGELNSLATLKNQLGGELNAEEWDADRLTRVEAIVARIQPLDASQAAAADRQVNSALAAALRAEIAQPLQPDALGRIRDMADRLSRRDADLGKELGERIKAREQHSELVFLSEAPFAHPDEAFAAGRVRAEGDLLAPEAPDAAGVVPTRHPCQGNVDFKAEFASPSWPRASRLGLVLYAGPKTNYTFRLRVSAPSGPGAGGDAPPASFEAARKGRASLVMEIARDGFPLRSAVVSAADAFDSCGPDGALRLWIKRQDDRLLFWVNGLSPLEFRDPFAIPFEPDAVFALEWPADVRLGKLSAYRQAAPAAPSPLEEGDALYERKDYAGALASYQRQGVAAQQAEVRQEARYKEGLCFGALNHSDEAVAAFQDVAAAPGDVWPVLADCQLWRSFLQGQDAEADLILARLLGRGLTFERLAVLLPDEERARLLGPYLQGGRWSLFADPERTLDRMRRVVEAHTLLQDKSDPNYTATDLHMILLLRMTGRDAEALPLAHDVLTRYKALDYTDLPRQVLEQYTWMLRLRPDGRQLALQELDRWLFDGARAVRSDNVGGNNLFVERARIQLALGDADAAHADLQTFFASAPEADIPDSYWVAARLLEGFLLEKKGDKVGAQDAWRRGLSKTPSDPAKASEGFADASPTPAIHRLIMASLTNQLSDDDARKFLGAMAGRLREGTAEGSNGSMVQAALQQVPPSVLRDMWLTPRGRDYAAKIAARDLSYREHTTVPILLFAATYIAQSGFATPPTPDQEELVWKLINSGYQAYLDGKIKEEQLVPMAAAWKLSRTLPLFLLWGAEMDKLTPEVRGPLAYVFAQRLLSGGRGKEAADLFKKARDDGEPGSLLRRLAEADLDRLNPK